ncbi:hypothetical protein Fot_28716 [Forsythia ovata]|uniref:Uncharacterized protein n=1 Tax=Forsythia ovata TaxID=205694 RepID=A0ABD1TQM7_9LAMI
MESIFSSSPNRSLSTSLGFQESPTLSSSSMPLFDMVFSPSSLITLFPLSDRRIFFYRNKGSSEGGTKEMSTIASGINVTVEEIPNAASSINRTVEERPTADSGISGIVATGTGAVRSTRGCEEISSFLPTTLLLSILNFGTLEK